MLCLVGGGSFLRSRQDVERSVNKKKQRRRWDPVSGGGEEALLGARDVARRILPHEEAEKVVAAPDRDPRAKGPPRPGSVGLQGHHDRVASSALAARPAPPPFASCGRLCEGLGERGHRFSSRGLYELPDVPASVLLRLEKRGAEENLLKGFGRVDHQVRQGFREQNSELWRDVAIGCLPRQEIQKIWKLLPNEDEGMRDGNGSWVGVCGRAGSRGLVGRGAAPGSPRARGGQMRPS